MSCHAHDDVMNTTTSLEDKSDSIPTTAHRDSGWLRVLARVQATSLDRRLAAGEATTSDRLLAARANVIVGWESRSRLADDWEQLLTMARGPVVPRSPRVPVRSQVVLAAEHQARELVAAIRQPDSVNPRGIARARLLLTDGAGPLFNPRRATDLIPALRSATTGCAGGRAANHAMTVSTRWDGMPRGWISD
jgi:hypothetical protein